MQQLSQSRCWHNVDICRHLNMSTYMPASEIVQSNIFLTLTVSNLRAHKWTVHYLDYGFTGVFPDSKVHGANMGPIWGLFIYTAIFSSIKPKRKPRIKYSYTRDLSMIWFTQKWEETLKRRFDRFLCDSVMNNAVYHRPSKWNYSHPVIALNHMLLKPKCSGQIASIPCVLIP